MKIKTVYPVLLFITIFLSFHCSKKEGSDLPPFENIITQGNWVVSAYSENGVNKTGDYNGNTFKFNMGGTLTATKGANTFPGNWSVTGTVRTFSFTISTFDVSLLALNGDWVVIAATTSDIQFTDGNDALTLHKQ